MARYFRADRLKLSRSTPSIEGSDFALVTALRKTNEDEGHIRAVLQAFEHLTAEAIRASLLELTVADADAVIALRAGQIVQCREVVRRAASIILQSAFLSDYIKKEAQVLLAGNSVRTNIAGHGIKKVRGANSRLKTN